VYSGSVLQSESNLPVLVFIHGGAFIRVRKILHWYYYTIGSVTNYERERERQLELSSYGSYEREKTAGIG